MRKAAERVCRRLQRFIGNLSIRKKVIVIYVFLIFVPACMLMGYFYHRSSVVIENEFNNSISQVLKQMDDDITYRLDNIQNISNLIFVSPMLEQYLGRGNDQRLSTYVEDFNDIGQLRTLFEDTKTSGSIYDIRIYADGKTVFGSEKDVVYPFSDIQQSGWYNEILQKSGGIYWKDTYSAQYTDLSACQVISCQRILRNPYSWDDINGVLSIDVPASSFFDILDSISLAKEENISIVNSLGTIIASDDKDRIGKQVSEGVGAILSPDREKNVYRLGKGKNASDVIVRRISLTGWCLVAQVPVRDIYDRNSIVSSRSGILAIIAMLAAFLLAIFLVFASLLESIVGRIREINNRMKTAGLESLEDGGQMSQGDICRLEGAVDNVIQTVRSLMDESYKAKLREREAQLKALQAQINPHFLYNTLDTIKWMALGEDYHGSVFMLNALSKYYRLSLHRGQDIVSVGDELELASVYIKLQQKRFHNLFRVRYDIDEEVKSYIMPKLTLQPIIENALVHGIQPKDEPDGMIALTARKEGADLIFTVEDNGVGMNPQQINRLLASTEENISKSYGLYNVNKRIKLFSGQEYGIEINSRHGAGTTVTIRLKAAAAGDKMQGNRDK